MQIHILIPKNGLRKYRRASIKKALQQCYSVVMTVFRLRIHPGNGGLSKVLPLEPPGNP